MVKVNRTIDFEKKIIKDVKFSIWITISTISLEYELVDDEIEMMFCDCLDSYEDNTVTDWLCNRSEPLKPFHIPEETSSYGQVTRPVSKSTG